ncbi:hypothetical protein IPA_08555 [Ignicoccus pacificus DSM 13166]|uniref:Uncharacterized protein n=1 Tax=Ignicoccus pacificus DSM 13166 TaxID=940294 RepID=A0A977KBW7_9CREN|nr:hypothetical protein IPA_08555 [Ignicoccus pacificus DSM 13166]
MKVKLTLLLLVTMVLAAPFRVDVTYFNPSAAKYLSIPFLKVSVTGDINLNNLNVSKVNIILNASSPVVIGNYTKLIENYLKNCNVQGTPLVSVTSCIMEALGKILGIRSVVPSNISQTVALSPEGYAIVAMEYKLNALINRDRFIGQALYYAKGGDEALEEVYHVELYTGGGGRLRISASVTPNIGGMGQYYKLSCAKGFALVTAISPPPTPPKMIRGPNFVKLVFPTDVVKYAVSYEGVSLWMPKTVWQYFTAVQRSVTIPIPCLSLSTLSVAPALPSQLACQLTFNVAARGEHTISITSPNGYSMVLRVQPFHDVTIPTPCKGVALFRVDNSTFLTDFANFNNSKLVIIPKAKVLRLVKIQANKDFLLDFNGFKVKCTKVCYLAAPPSQLELVVVDPTTQASKLLVLSPIAKAVNVIVPTKPLYKSCGAYLVSPKPITVKLYFKSTTSILEVSTKPKFIILPCNTPITAKVENYMAQFSVSGNKWVVFCPGVGVSTGSAVNVTAKGFKTPISFSCDGGNSWVMVDSSNFILVRPDYPLMLLKFVGSSGSMAYVYVPYGIYAFTVTPNVKPSTTKGPLPPNMPLTQLIDVRVHKIKGTFSKLYLELSDGKYALKYPIMNETMVAVPPQWVKTKLQGLLQVVTKIGMKMYNFTLPQLYSGKYPDGKPVIASIDLFVDSTAYNFFYHSVKIVIVDKNGVPKEGRVLIEDKYPVEVKGATVIVYPKNVMSLTFAGKRFRIALNGQTVYLNVSSPQVSKQPLNAYITVDVLRYGKPINVTLQLSTQNGTLTYTAKGMTKLAVPSSWLNTTIYLTVYYNGTVHQAAIPPLVTSVGMNKIVSPIYIFLDNMEQYNYYSAKIITVTKKGFFTYLANANVTIDGKYKIPVYGSVVIVYPKKNVKLSYPGGTLDVVLGGNEIYLTLKSMKKQPKPVAKNQTQKTEVSIGELMKEGKIKMWNPWKNLPAILMLSTSLLLSMSVVYTAGSYPDLIGAAAFAIAALTIIAVYIALAIWFANTIGAPS